MLRVSVLGEQTIADDGSGSVRARSSRAVVLVAYLACHAGSPQTRQRIAALFWPDSSDGQSLTNLRRELHQLRQILGDEPSLVVSAGDLCWHDTGTCRVDLRIFDVERKAALAAATAGDDQGVLQHAAAAIAEYGGELLPSGASALTCAIWSVRRGSGPASWPGRWMPRGAACSWSRWRRSGTGP